MNSQTQETLKNAYSIDIGLYISRGFELFKQNIGGYVGYTVLLAIISFIINIIPIVNIFSFLITPCLIFGYHLVNRLIATNNSEPPFGTYFKGFDYFKKLVGISLLSSLIFVAALVPFAFLIGVDSISELSTGEAEPFFDNFKGVALIFFLLALLGIIYLGVSWTFASMISVFQDKGSWEAMEISRKVVSRNWFMLLLFLTILGLLNIAGAIFLFIGLLFTVPFTLCSIYAAYEEIFGYEDATYSQEDDDQITSIGESLN